MPCRGDSPEAADLADRAASGTGWSGFLDAEVCLMLLPITQPIVRHLLLTRWPCLQLKLFQIGQASLLQQVSSSQPSTDLAGRLLCQHSPCCRRAVSHVMLSCADVTMQEELPDASATQSRANQQERHGSASSMSDTDAEPSG